LICLNLSKDLTEIAEGLGDKTLIDRIPLNLPNGDLQVRQALLYLTAPLAKVVEPLLEKACAIVASKCRPLVDEGISLGLDVLEFLLKVILLLP
jgi:hypothetical protein